MKKQSAHDTHHKPEQCESMRFTRVAATKIFHDADIPAAESRRVADPVNPSDARCQASATGENINRKSKNSPLEP